MESISGDHEFEDPLGSVSSDPATFKDLLSFVPSALVASHVKWGQASEVMVMEKFSWKPLTLARWVFIKKVGTGCLLPRGFYEARGIYQRAL